MRFEHPLERSVRRAKILQEPALREGETGKARVWGTVAKSRSKRLSQVLASRGMEGVSAAHGARIAGQDGDPVLLEMAVESGTEPTADADLPISGAEPSPLDGEGQPDPGQRAV